MFSELVIPLAGIALPAVLVPTILAFRHSAKKREYEHAERMKALETGQPVPGEANWAGAFVCAVVGAGVPLGAFLFTFMASMNNRDLDGEVWMAPAAVSFIALMSTMSLAKSVFRPQKVEKTDAPLNGKPAMDPESSHPVGWGR